MRVPEHPVNGCHPYGLLAGLACRYDIGLNPVAGNTSFARAVSYLVRDRNKLQSSTRNLVSFGAADCGGRSTFLL